MSLSMTTASKANSADDSIKHGLSLPSLDGTRPDSSSKVSAKSLFVVMDDEDSRECPSQGAGEMARDSLFRRGIDERRGHGFGLQASNLGILQPKSFLQHRSFGPRRHSTGSYREGRDSQSFDTCDSDSDDDYDDYDITRNPRLPFCHARKVQLQRSNNSSITPAVVLGDQKMLAVDDNRNKRKTPSPVLGEEPAPVSVAHSITESMDTEETLRTQETCDSTEAGYDSDDNMQPGRRVSLSPISRRLTLQFDSISFLSPAKPSRAKRRKTIDTSANSP